VYVLQPGSILSSRTKKVASTEVFDRERPTRAYVESDGMGLAMGVLQKMNQTLLIEALDAYELDIPSVFGGCKT